MDLSYAVEALSAFSHEPSLVYASVIFLLTASSFGLPIPEEVTLVSAGVIAHFGLKSAQDPTFSGAVVNPELLAAICFAAVMASDLLVFGIGVSLRKYVGGQSRVQRWTHTKAFQKAARWTVKHGGVMAGVFRFTPGLRFPGHMACGFLGVSAGKFALIDGTAALLTVPTQVLLIAYYGDTILGFAQNVKIALICVLLVGVLGYFLRHAFVGSTASGDSNSEHNYKSADDHQRAAGE